MHTRGWCVGVSVAPRGRQSQIVQDLEAKIRDLVWMLFSVLGKLLWDFELNFLTDLYCEKTTFSGLW